MSDTSNVRARFMEALARGMSTAEATAYANKFAEIRSPVKAPTEALRKKIEGGSHPLDHDGNGKPGGSTAPEQTDDLPALRAKYQRVIGKRPFAGWSADVLKEKIANHEG